MIYSGKTHPQPRSSLDGTRREPAMGILISTDSFGGVHEVLKGWTPESDGIFTYDLTRARRQLVATFEVNGSGMLPIAAGTDIIGGLWHMKAFFESRADSYSSGSTKRIWIFSDMMNETAKFPMPALLGTGPERMLERANAEGLLVPRMATRFMFRARRRRPLAAGMAYRQEVLGNVLRRCRRPRGVLRSGVRIVRGK